MHANRFCCFLVLLPVCSALRHTACSASRQASAIGNQEDREDEPPAFYPSMYSRKILEILGQRKPTDLDGFEGNGSQASNIERAVADQKWAVAFDGVSVYEAPRKNAKKTGLALGQVVEVDGPVGNGWLKLNEGYVRQDDDEPLVRPILEAPPTSLWQTAMYVLNWFSNSSNQNGSAMPEELVLMEEIDESQRLAPMRVCADVYNALLGDDINVTAWDQPLADYDKVLKPFLEAIDDPTNPLFVGASPLERTKWKYRDTPQLVEIVFPDPQNVMVIGDIHGRLGSLRKAHKKWKSYDVRPYVVMTGDMVDRGNRQVEVAAALLAWRCQFPDRVMVLHGNHEDETINSFYGLQCADFVGPFEKVASNPDLFERLNSIFQKIPTALVIKQPHPYEAASGVFMHGSFGPKAFEASSSKKVSDIPEQVLTEMKWNERNVKLNGDNCKFGNRTTWFQESARGGGTQVFCPRIGFHFMRNLGVCNLLTGHSHFNTVHQRVIPQESYDGNMEDPRAVASLAGCPEMNHVVTLSAHKFNGHGKVTMVRPRPDSELGIISQENLFGKAGKETREEWALDIGVAGGRYPDIMGGIFENQVNIPDLPRRSHAWSQKVWLPQYFAKHLGNLSGPNEAGLFRVSLPSSEMFCSVYKY